MSKLLQEVGSVLGFAFSAKVRRKASLMVREKWLTTRLPGSASNSPVADLPPDDPVERFSCHQISAMDPDFFERSATVAIEDQLKDGAVHATHDYEVHRLYGAKSYTNETTHRSIFDRDGHLIPSLSHTRPGSKAVDTCRMRPRQTIKGITANLYGTRNCAEANYVHWLVDALARLFIIERYHDLDSVDQVLVPPLKYDFQHQSLSALGFGKDRIVELHPLDCLEFECLLASSSPRGKGSSICPDWIIERFNTEFSEEVMRARPDAGERVYVSRRDAPSRMFENEQDVCDLMARRGFSVVELTPLDLWEKIAVFKNASHIVSQTGAGLGNLMFCSPGAHVLELVDERFVYPMYASMAIHRGAEHTPHYFVDDSAMARIYAVAAKSTLDISALEAHLDSLGF